MELLSPAAYQDLLKYGPLGFALAVIIIFTVKDLLSQRGINSQFRNLDNRHDKTMKILLDDNERLNNQLSGVLFKNAVTLEETKSSIDNLVRIITNDFRRDT